MLCYVHNMAVQGAFQKKLAKKLETQTLIRESMIWAASTRTFFFVEYISTHDNIFADNLSRLRLQNFKQLAHERNLLIHKQPLPFVLAPWK